MKNTSLNFKKLLSWLGHNEYETGRPTAELALGSWVSEREDVKEKNDITESYKDIGVQCYARLKRSAENRA